MINPLYRDPRQFEIAATQLVKDETKYEDFFKLILPIKSVMNKLTEIFSFRHTKWPEKPNLKTSYFIFILNEKHLVDIQLVYLFLNIERSMIHKSYIFQCNSILVSFT